MKWEIAYRVTKGLRSVVDTIGLLAGRIRSWIRLLILIITTLVLFRKKLSTVCFIIFLRSSYVPADSEVDIIDLWQWADREPERSWIDQWPMRLSALNPLVIGLVFGTYTEISGTHRFSGARLRSYLSDKVRIQCRKKHEVVEMFIC